MSTAVLEQPASASTIGSIGDDELYEIIDGERVRTPPKSVLAVWTAFQLARFLAASNAKQGSRLPIADANHRAFEKRCARRRDGRAGLQICSDRAIRRGDGLAKPSPSVRALESCHLEPANFQLMAVPVAPGDFSSRLAWT